MVTAPRTSLVADGGGLEKGPNPCVVISRAAGLISALSCPREESSPRAARPLVRLGPTRSVEGRTFADQ